MPLRLQKPRKGYTPFWTIRGEHLGVRVYKSSRTDRRPLAAAQLKKLERAIERGEYPPPRPAARGGQPTFLTAAVAYMEAGGSRRYIAPLIKHFGETPLTEVDQAAIDRAAIAMHPNVTPATRNTYVYTPVSAVLHHAGVNTVQQPNGMHDKIRRPKGAKGRVVIDFLTPDDAFAIIAAADKIDAEYGLYLRFLLYTGTRVGEPLKITWDKVMLDENAAWLPDSKNGDPRMLRLRDDLRDALARHRPENATGRVFRFRQGGHHTYLLVRAKLAALGIVCPVRRPVGWRQPPNRLTWVNHKVFRHTWATWMRRYGGLDGQGLVGTGNWRDRRSAERYSHVVFREEWSRVDNLPSLGAKGVQKARDAS